MDVKEFAERVLFGNTLEDKLVRPDSISYGEKYDALKKTPRIPGRPGFLDLDSWQNRKKTPFPSVDKLEHESYRGLVFHFFANHELLALELMALLLLKFPETPTAFKRGIV